MFPAVFGLIAVAMVGIAFLVFVVQARARDATERAYRDMLVANGLRETDSPMGLRDEQLRRFDLLPAGDRDSSAVWAAQGELEASVAGSVQAMAACAFEWWWEREHTSTDSNGNRQTSHQRRSTLACLCRLPGDLAGPYLRVSREGFLARMGIGRGGDFRVESDAFNKEFDVRVEQPESAIRLLDAGFQEAFLREHGGRYFELSDVWLLVVHDSAGPGIGFHRGGATGIAGLFGQSGDRAVASTTTIEALPGLITSAKWLLELIPDGYWRGLRAGTPQ